MADISEGQEIRTNLLSPVNRIVVPSLLPNECFLQQRDLLNHLKEADGFPPDIANYPFGIVTVLGSDKNHTRKIYSDWLIHYFDNSGKPSNTNIGTSHELEHMQIAIDTLPGIYIWPKKYIIYTKDNLLIVLLIIHVDGKSEPLENFAAVASSNILVFREREKDNLWSRVKDIYVKAAISPAALSVHWSTYLSEIVDKDENKAAKDFFKHLDGCMIQPVKQDDGTDILFKDILLHFVNVESKINAAAINIRPVVAEQVNVSANRSLPITTSNSETANTNSGNQILPPASLDYVVSDHVTQENKTNIHKEPIPSVQCSKSCTTLQKQLEIVLDDWLSKYLTPASITDMMKCCVSYVSFDSHNVFGELSSLVGIILAYNSQMGNMFDNYVCFAGDEDKKQFHRLAESAYRHALKILQSKTFVHIELTEKLLHSASVALQAFYRNENNAIAIHETQLTKKILETLQLEYKKKMKTYFTSQLTQARIKDIHAQIKFSILSMAERALNFNEKFNYILKKRLDCLSNDLNQMYLLLTKEFSADFRLKGTLNEFNDYMDKYLKQFYTDTLPSLHLLSTEQLTEHHNNVVSNVTSDIEWEQGDTMLLRLYTHLVYITEIAEQEQDVINLNEKAKAGEKVFCLYLTPDWFAIKTKTNNGIIGMRYGPHKTLTPPALAALTHNNQVLLGLSAANATKKYPKSLKTYGQILQFISKSVKDDHNCSYLLVEFFKKVKNDVDKCFGGDFMSAIVIVPSWLNVEHRLRLRNFARCAGIKKLFLVNEATLLAYNLLCIKPEPENVQERQKPEFVITVCVSENGISIEVFTLKHDSQIYQVAVAFTGWQAVTTMHDSVWNALNPFQVNAAITNPFSRANPSSDFLATLQIAFQSIFSQTQCSLQNRLVNFCVISEHSEFDHLFNDFFQEFKSWSKVENFQIRNALFAATQFLECPQNLVRFVLSHGADVEYFDVIRQTYLKNFVSVGTSCDDADNSHSSVISKEKLILIEKCHNMREQLKAGKVKVRKLMLKVILECIERAEKAASDAHTTNDMLTLEEQELNELIDEHKFDI